ncbi:MAG TPA: hydroxymethylbilane synthase, partial [Saprospiraceae bacterium]|nr:hydroxymethylbilane synthase [Saprospiraceae bacterium]
LEGGQIFRLKTGATVGSSAARRKAQLADYRPDLVLKDIRGNVPTRLQRLRDGDFDAIFLAAAGLNRLGVDLSGLERIELHPREFVPAPAQGVLAWQTHRDDTPTRLLLRRLHHPEVSAVTNVERRVLQLLDGGCQLPLGVYCERDAAGHFHAHAACMIGTEMRRVRVSSSTSFDLAETVVQRLKAAE